MARRALIVGGAGATGQHMAHGLAELGFELAILHRGAHEPEALQRYRHIHADPHFEAPVRAAIGGETFDLVILTYGRIQVLAKLFSGRCGQLIAIGGVPIYAGFIDPDSVHPPGMPVAARESAPIAEPARIQPESAAKFVAKMVASEAAVMNEHRRGGYAATIFRYPRIYGPNSIVSQDWSLVRRIRDRRPFVLLPNGGMTLFSRCAAMNAAHSVLLAVDRREAAGEVFNCGDDEQFSLRQWAALQSEALGAKIELVGLPPSLDRVAAHFALYGGHMFGHGFTSTAKVRDVLGYADVISARQAIAESARWWYDHGAAMQAGMIARDPFDYGMEDAVMRDLEALAARYRHVDPVANLPAHSYPHPKTPTLGRDHKGR